MNPAAGRPWGRLAVLSVAVLAAHLLVLGASRQRLAPAQDASVRFAVRALPPVQAPLAGPPPAAPLPTSPVARTAKGPVRPPSPPAGAPPRRPAPAPPATQALAEPEVHTPAPAATASLPQIRAIPQPGRLRYALTVQTRTSTVHGEASLEWRHDGRDYEARLELTGAGYRGRVQRSTGRIAGGGLVPGYFSDRFHGEQATHFEPEQGRVVFSSNRPAVPWVDGIQDRLSVIVQLSMLVASEPGRFAPGTEIVIPTAGTREAEGWIFRVEGEEHLQLPGGAMRGLKLQRLPRGEYDQRLELWLAPGMDYAPVRLRLTNPDGGVVEQRWTSTDRR